MRVKALARCVNNFDAADYATGLKLMYRLQARTDKGIMFRRHGAGNETVPMNRRLKAEDGFGHAILRWTRRHSRRIWREGCLPLV